MNQDSKATLLRGLPSVHAILEAMRPRAAAGDATPFAREALEEARRNAQTSGAVPDLDALAERALQLQALANAPTLVPVINASGVILQTNLGRAPLSDRALQAARAVSTQYSNLEFDLEAGTRGSRHEHARTLIRRVTGAGDAMVVNNNAAAVYLVLHALTGGREVIVSRGQAVEIGGEFRIPDIVAESGARIVEVGTTNRTAARDYANAITEETGAILRVHRSNFRISGFVTEPSLSELASTAREHGVLLLDDLGSGVLIDTAQFGMTHEPTVQESLSGGADLVLFSGDKLLGGPQCGIIAGRADLIERLRRHPLARVLRVDKLTFAALSATLLAYAQETALEEIPIWRMVSTPLESLEARAAAWVAAAGTGEVLDARTMLGGGSLPEESVPTRAAAIDAPDGATALAASLRQNAPAIIARIQDERVLLDPRTVDPRTDGLVSEALATLVAAPTS